MQEKSIPKAENCPAEKADDGKIASYFQEVDEQCFDPAVMKDAAAQDPVKSRMHRKAEKKTNIEEERDEIKDNFLSACRYGKADEELEAWEKISQDSYWDDQREALLRDGLSSALNKLTDNFRTRRVDQIVRLLERGATFEENEEKLFSSDKLTVDGPYYNDYANAFWQEYRKDPRPERVKDIFHGINDAVFYPIMDRFANRLKMYMEYLRAGSVPENQRKRFGEFPDGKSFPKVVVGLKILVSGDKLRVYIRGGKDELLLFSLEPQEAKDVVATFSDLYIDYLTEKIEELAKEGLFDGLFDSGVMVVLFDKTAGTVFSCYTTPISEKEIEEKIKYCETTTDWSNAFDDVFQVGAALIFGGYQNQTADRGVKLLERYLEECGDAKLYKKMASSIDELTHEHPAFYYLLAKEYFGRLDYGWAMEYSARSVREGYPAAQQFNDEVTEIAERYEKIQEIYEAYEQEKGSLQAAAAGGFNLAEAKYAWADQRFEEAFTEDDLCIETANILGRARESGNIYIRFLVEGEEGYREALTFINNLLEKGYAQLAQGWCKGYALYIRFVHEPVFIKQADGAELLGRLKWPKTSCHAFFARAVQYPALRELVKDYTERALNMYTWYLDLEDEYNTIPGTFAAVALAFCSKEYLPVLQNFANAVDGEHSYYHWRLPAMLADYYGEDPDLAPVLMDLAMAASDNGCYKKISKDLLWSASFIEKMLDYTGTDVSDRGRLESYCFAWESLYGGKGKSNLKKLQEHASGASNDREIRIFTEFHNFYLEALKNNSFDDTNYDKIAPLADAGVGEEESEKPVLQDQDAVASEKDTKDSDPEKVQVVKGKFISFFFPSCILDWDMFNELRTCINKMTKLAMDHSYLTFNHGDFVIKMKDWVIGSDDLKYEYGLIVFDGKNKPAILYGNLMLDKLVPGIIKKWPKTSQEYEDLRLKNHVKDAPLRRTDDEWKHANTVMTDYLATGGITTRSFLTIVLRLEQVPPSEKLAYVSARILLSYFAESRNDLQAMQKYFSELKELQPEKAAYWQEKYDEAAELIKRYERSLSAKTS